MRDEPGTKVPWTPFAPCEVAWSEGLPHRSRVYVPFNQDYCGGISVVFALYEEVSGTL